jgi:hypothetical protein
VLFPFPDALALADAVGVVTTEFVPFPLTAFPVPSDASEDVVFEPFFVSLVAVESV